MNRDRMRLLLTPLRNDRSMPLSYARRNFKINWCRPHPVRGLKLLREPFFYHLQTIIVFQYRHSVGLRHPFHIIHLFETTVLYILPAIFEKTVRIGSPSKIFSTNATVPSDIWSVGKEQIAMFEFTTWQASFTDFFRC